MKIHIRSNKRFLKIGAALLCFALVFGQAGALLAGSPGTGSGAASGTGSGVASGAYRDVAAQLAAAEAAKPLFTLKDIQDLARAHGAEARQARLGVANAEAGRESAQIAVYDAWGAASQPPPSFDTGFPALDEAMAQLMSSMGMGNAGASIVGASARLEEANISLDDAKATLETAMEEAMYNGENLFFSYLQLQRTLTSLESALELSRQQVRIEELKATIGLSTATEVQKRKLALAELEESRQALLNGLDMTGRSLMRQIGKDVDTLFRLDPSYSIEGLRTVYDPEQLADLAIKSNLNLGVLSRSIDKLADTISEPATGQTMRSQLAAQRDSLILTRNNLTHSLRLLARSTATGLETARADMALMQRKIDEKQLAYDVLELQVRLGLAPRIGLQAAEMELLTAKNDLLKAQQDYYLSLRRAALLVRGVAISPGGGGGF